MKNLALYIHIPFCEKKCYYCDFTSFIKNEANVEEYINYLLNEMSMYKEKLKEYSIETIFIGGGTPSTIPGKYIHILLDYIYNNFHVSKLKEVTIEINPGTLTYEKAKIYKESGINRISLGVQSLDDKVLEKIGRIHKAKDFFYSYEMLQSLGLNNINVDLMFGLPGQELDKLLRDIKIISSMNITHISYYGLILEPGTVFYNMYKKGKLELPSEEVERLMYHKGIELLEERGYKHYEISNISKKGYECMHHNFYWRIKPYLGVGVSSHSNIENVRFWNFSKLNDYYNKLDNESFPVENKEIINKELEIAEYLIMGIRYIDGINIKEFKNRFNLDIMDIYSKEINKHIQGGLLTQEGPYIKLTEKGLDLSNLVEVDFLP